MDGSTLTAFLRQTRVTGRPRVSRIALVCAVAVLAPATAAFAVSDETRIATPGFDTDIAAPEPALPDLPGIGSDEPAFAEPEADAVPDALADIAQDLGTGIASWYGPRFAGRQTASGERFDPAEYTAAHRTLPFGSLVRVTSERTGKSIVVRINDRGPFHGNRVIDLSEAAADAIGLKARGKGRVALSLLAG